MSFLKSRVGFDVTYYDAKTVNQILPVSVSNATGYNYKVINSGILQNKGIELTVYGSPVKTSNFAWDISVNWTRNRNKVVDLYTDANGDPIDNIILGSFQGSITINATLGQPYGTIHGTDYTYYNDASNPNNPANGQRLVSATTGRYIKTTSNNFVIGNANPDWLAGITNKVTYKGLFFSFLIDIKKGGDVFSTDLYYGLSTGLYPETAGNNDLGNPLRNTNADGGGLIRPGVTPDGKTNTLRSGTSTYGAYGYRYDADKAFVYDAGYVKLREAALGFSFPKRMFSKGVIKGIDLSLVGRNLWIIDKSLPYADPEEGFGSGNLQGTQTGAYPTVRSIGFNVKVKL